MIKCEYCKNKLKQTYGITNLEWCILHKEYVHNLEKEEKENCKNFEVKKICENCKYFGKKYIYKLTKFNRNYCFKNEKETNKIDSCNFFEKNIDILGEK